MTPKEKAKELRDRYYEFLYKESKTAIYINEEAKQCALIAVDEILKSKRTAYRFQIVEMGRIFIEYWEEVKTEIEKL